MAQVVINIDDNERFKEIINNEIEALDHQELQQVILSAFKEVLSEDNYQLTRSLLTERGRNYEYIPSQLTISLCEKCDVSGLQEIVDTMIDTLKNRLNSILKEVLLDIMIKGISDTYSFKQSMEFIARNELYKAHQEEQQY